MIETDKCPKKLAAGFPETHYFSETTMKKSGNALSKGGNTSFIVCVCTILHTSTCQSHVSPFGAGNLKLSTVNQEVVLL